MVSAEKKRGKNTFAASYGVQDQATTLSWTNKPLKVGASWAWVATGGSSRQELAGMVSVPGQCRAVPSRLPAGQLCLPEASWRLRLLPHRLPLPRTLPQVVLRGKAGPEGVKGVQATLLVTKVRKGPAGCWAWRPSTIKSHALLV